MMIIMTFGIRDLSEWPVGPGQLTARGKRMHYHLGQVHFIIIMVVVMRRVIISLGTGAIQHDDVDLSLTRAGWS